MRQSGGRDIVGFQHHAAGAWLLAFADLLENLVAARLRQRARDARELLIAESAAFGICHADNVVTIACRGKRRRRPRSRTGSIAQMKKARDRSRAFRILLWKDGLRNPCRRPAASPDPRCSSSG